MFFSAIARITANSAMTFAVKNSFCVVALDNVRKSLQQVITEVVTPSLGRYVAPVVGMQLGTMCAIPVTLFLGEMVAKAVRELAKAIHNLFKAIIYGIDDSNSRSLCKELVFGITSFAIGFFAKLYFCNYGMGPVGTCLKIGTSIAAPLCSSAFPIALAAPAIAILATPTVTFMVGDIVGSIASNASYEVFDRTFSFLKPSKKH